MGEDESFCFVLGKGERIRGNGAAHRAREPLLRPRLLDPPPPDFSLSMKKHVEFLSLSHTSFVSLSLTHTHILSLSLSLSLSHTHTQAAHCAREPHRSPRLLDPPHSQPQSGQEVRELKKKSTKIDTCAVLGMTEMPEI